MIKYHQESISFQDLQENNIDRLQLQMIPVKTKILEIGCATGSLSEYLIKEKGCTVVGIEPSREQAEIAIKRGLTVKIGSIDDIRIQAELDREVGDQGPFDVLFMSQVIEHIANPEELLLRAKDWLSPSGVLIISTCNIAHWKCRFRLLGGTWHYQDYGIFDRTHLRFFTIKSFREMLTGCGFETSDFAFTFEDICPFKLLFDTRIIAPSDLLRLIPFAGKSLRKRYTNLTKNFIATQFVFQARIKSISTL